MGLKLLKKPESTSFCNG